MAGRSFNRAPFFGKGIGFPFRLNAITGGVTTTEGISESVSVALEYIHDRYTIREDVEYAVNHIAECIAHILLTRVLEHDTLPEFGSRLHFILFEPNHGQTYLEAEYYFQESTVRWEKRARIPTTGGVEWAVDGRMADLGRLGCIVRPEFIKNQSPGNLVTPFVTPRLAREAEYPSQTYDASGHDYDSRYYGAPVYESGGEKYIRLPITRRRFAPGPEDQYYEAKYRDSWLLAAFDLFGQKDGSIRYWPIIASMSAQDAAEAGYGREWMDNCGDPIHGDLLRVPTYSRLLMTGMTGV